MTCTFSAEQIASLSAPLDRAKVRQRRQGRSQVSYLEGWQVIAEANRIFGFGGWQRETVTIRCVHQADRLIGEEQRPGWGVTYSARVRISVSTAGQPVLIREGCGAGHGIDADLGQAHESALKEAETDAMKRALMTFGNAFGLALYDKQQREVTGEATGVGDRSSAVQASRPRATPLRVVPPQQLAALKRQGVESKAPAVETVKADPSVQPSAPAVEPVVIDPALEPLDQATIHQLVDTICSLPRPALEGFTKAFRKRFQVPIDAPSIADRIRQRCHHDWIEAFLVQHKAA
jgi:DNA recombination protein Rad52